MLLFLCGRLFNITILLLLFEVSHYTLVAPSPSSTTQGYIWTTNPGKDESYLDYSSEPVSTSAPRAAVIMAPEQTTVLEQIPAPATPQLPMAVSKPTSNLESRGKEATSPVFYSITEQESNETETLSTATQSPTEPTTLEPVTTQEPTTVTTQEPTTTSPDLNPKNLKVESRALGNINVTWQVEIENTSYSAVCYRQRCSEDTVQNDSCTCEVQGNKAVCTVPSKDSAQLLNITVVPTGDPNIVPCEDCSVLIVAVPSPPEKLQVLPLNTTAVNVSWSSPETDCTTFSYVIKSTQSYPTDSTSRVIGSIPSNTLVSITVQIRSHYGNDTVVGPAGNEISTYTYPDPVHSLEVTATSDSLGIEWQEPSGNGSISAYIIVVTESDSGNCILEAHISNYTKNATAGNCTLYDRRALDDKLKYRAYPMEPCNNYTVSVTAENEAGPSEVKTESKTTKVADPHEQIQEVYLLPANYSIQVTWKPINGPGKCPVIDYVIEYEFKNCAPTGDRVLKYNKTVENNGLEKMIETIIDKGIQPFWNYTVQVSARTVENGGFGNSTSAANYTKTEIDTPGPPIALNSTDGSEPRTVDLEWNKPYLCERNGPISKYNVSYVCQNLAVDARALERDLTTVDNEEHTWNINPYRMCNFSVIALNGNLEGLPVTESHQTPEAGPSEVEMVDIATGPTWIFLNWSEPAEPNGVIQNYTIEYIALGFVDGIDNPQAMNGIVTTNNSDTTYNIIGLQEYTSYNFTVWGTTNGGPGIRSDFKLAQTRIGDPLPVTVLKKEPSKTAILVTWTPQKRTGPTNYSIQAVAVDGDDNTATYVVGYNNTSGNVTGLSSYVNYTITVQTLMATGNATSQRVYQITNQDIPGPVTSANFTSTNTTITARWEAPKTPNGVLLFYTITYRPLEYADGEELNHTFGECSKNATGPDQEQELTGLDPFICYEIKIFGWTEIGPAENSQHFNASTTYGDPTPVSNIEVSVAQRFLNVSWSPPKPRTGITEYNISAVDWKFGDKVESQTVAVEQAILGVKPHRTYTVYVTTLISTGDDRMYLTGDQIPTKNYTTLEDKPESRPEVNASRWDKNNCTVQILKWKPLDARQRNGKVTHYTIELQKNKISVFSETVQSIEEKEDTNAAYNSSVPVEAGTEYTVEISAATNIGNGPSGLTSIQSYFCAPPYPDGESPSEPTKVVEEAQNVEKQRTQIEVTISRDFYTNNDGGDVNYRGLIVAQEDQAADDTVGVNGTILESLDDFQKKYANVWSEVKEDDNMRPYRIQLPDDIFKEAERSSGLSRVSKMRPADIYSDAKLTFTVGANSLCETIDSRSECNGPLKEGKSYKFRAVGCTKGGCTLTSYSSAVDTIPAQGPGPGGIVAAVIVPLLIVIAGGVLFFMYRQDLGPFAPRTARPVSASDSHGGIDNQGMMMTDVPPNPVPLSEFTQHVILRHKNSDLIFSEEYKLLKEISPRMTWNAAETPYNRNKNRYNNILPYDHSRVKLLAADEEDEAGSDYINANFMPGYNSKREFIANQGPLESTKDDFWRMVWEQNVPIIVMVTKCIEKGRHKCAKYWPDDNEPVYYGDLQVQIRSESVLNNYTLRIIDISMGESKRSVLHFNFVMWPDFGCPDSTEALLQFVMTVRAHRSVQQKGPLIIHCSAGVGRTGTFICVDRLLQHMRDHDEVDVFGTILEMRRYRTNMVQTEDQYIYIHDCLRDALAQGLHKRYPTNSPQLPPDLSPPQTQDDEKHLYENVEITVPHGQILPDQGIANGNSTGL